jgi:hypothetical protein
MFALQAEADHHQHLEGGMRGAGPGEGGALPPAQHGLASLRRRERPRQGKHWPGNRRYWSAQVRTSGQVGLGWVGPGLARLGWAGLGLVGLGWPGLD